MLPALDGSRNSLLLRPDAEKDAPVRKAALPSVFTKVTVPESSGAPANPTALIPTPTTVEETGLATEHVLALAMKVLYAGEISGRALSDQIKITWGILEPIISQARVEMLIEVKRAQGVGTAGYEYALSDRGRDRTKQFLDVNGYVGPAPVPLDQYVRYVRELSKHNKIIDRDVIAAGFTDLVVGDECWINSAWR